MVEYISDTGRIFYCLSDDTRRDILLRLRDCDMTVGEIATEYNISMAAVSKHIDILEEAGLVSKQKLGRKRIISLQIQVLIKVQEYIEDFGKLDVVPNL